MCCRVKTLNPKPKPFNPKPLLTPELLSPNLLRGVHGLFKASSLNKFQAGRVWVHARMLWACFGFKALRLIKITP